ncbi:MAG: MBL fold metallo-hydrolase [Acidobacteria bacterium]|nr:MAG: MBL fold metallo-hydrolase [Acidobacteriota bacterium]REK02029.1 MAG: MBL fold metallo-hydrolase [Acidobacteriota bacterium]REK14987.1 MAG: MBL fold metallo-hydrolase [Acidobacteriota bacterium]REK45701.1 MAG: MBL fold metallo-hydrolase [Acidobacteriota bacterium]
MKFKQFYLGCLAHASYYIGSEDVAAIVDPQRDVDQYIEEAEANGQRIKYVIETHSHADFVSGHIELAERTGAEIIYGERAATEFPTLKVKDGDELTLGKVKLSFLETPGHTPEGITILAEDTDDPEAPIKMFTGDTLFIGDVGRPDLVGSKGFTAEEMAGMLYDSLHEKILPLPDETEVYPAHGAGSLCGKSLSSETWSTLGQQRATNYALKPMSKEDFVRIVAADQPEVPAYFPVSAQQNLKGSSALEDLKAPTELDTNGVKDFDGIVLDVRQNTEYGASHIPNSINIGLGGQFASWAGTLITVGSPIAVVADTKSQIDEAVMRLARVGIETAVGYILMSDYDGPTRTTEQIPVTEVSKQIQNGAQFVDVRRPAEHASNHAAGTLNLPLNELSREVGRLDPDKPTYVICQSGYRSSTGTSILENAGIKQIYNVAGGTNAWIKAALETEESSAACVNA